jgi:hypothetical protein
VTQLLATSSQVLWHRLRANHLAERLPAGAFEDAAFAGLQDSAPRAALTALHARVHDVGADDWEHPSLVQTWAPRGAVFVVPRADLGVFARGIVPRDPDARRMLDDLANRARAAARGSPLKDAGTFDLGAIPAALGLQLRGHPVARLAFAVAGVQVRWDARRTQLLDTPLPEVEPEDARRELLRRFLRSLGPAGPKGFARWAAVSADDARTTFQAIDDELVDIRWPDGSGSLLAADAEALLMARPLQGIRLLAFGADPVLQRGQAFVAGDPARRRAALPRRACTGMILSDGDVVASWGRGDGRIVVHALRTLGRDQRLQIEREAATVPTGPERTRVVWMNGP